MDIISPSLKKEIHTLSAESRPGMGALLKCKCPRCRKGNMFQDTNPWNLRSTMKMNKECPVCQQPLNIEVGFYYGSSYISYGLTVFLSVVTLIGWWLIAGFSEEKSLWRWIVLNAVLLLVLQPYLMRVSRTLWLAFFVRYNKNWRTEKPAPLERTNREQENNW